MADGLGMAVSVGGLVFVAATVAANGPEVRAALAGADAALLGAALVLAGAGMTAIALAWQATGRAFGFALGRAQAVAVYFRGEIGKYVPGAVWATVGRAELARRAGSARAPAYASVLFSLAALYTAGAAMAAALLPAGTDGTGRSAWPVLAAGVGVLLLHPRILGAVVAGAGRLTGRSALPAPPGWGRAVGLVGRHVPAWLLIASATWVVTRALGADAGWSRTALATTLSWLGGFLAVPAPGGLGVREAIFAAASGLGPGAGVAAALTARALFVAVDVVGALVGWAAEAAAARRRRRSSGPPSTRRSTRPPSA